jgi:hypothetical protein
MEPKSIKTGCPSSPSKILVGFRSLKGVKVTHEHPWTGKLESQKAKELWGFYRGGEQRPTVLPLSPRKYLGPSH